MSEVPLLSLAKIKLGGRVVGIFRFENQGSISISFCFSQVDMIQCINEIKEKNVYFEEEDINNFFLNAEKAGVPDFDVNEKITFDDFTSRHISIILTSLRVILGNQDALDSLFKEYKASGCKSYWLPNKTALLGEISPADLKGFYFNANPIQAGILHSKSHGGELLRISSSKKMKKLIRRCALQDDCLDPIDWLEGPAAEVFGFFSWLNMGNI